MKISRRRFSRITGLSLVGTALLIGFLAFFVTGPLFGQTHSDSPITPDRRRHSVRMRSHRCGYSHLVGGSGRHGGPERKTGTGRTGPDFYSSGRRSCHFRFYHGADDTGTRLKYFVIGDEDTVIGFGLVGVDGRQAATAEEAESAFQTALDDPETGIVLINESVAGLIRPRIEEFIFTRTFPLILEIPGREGRDKDRPGLKELVNEAIGIKL